MAPDERATADARIAERLFALPAWREARVVFAYLSFGSEVDTRRVIERAWAEGKTVALPRCMTAPAAEVNPPTVANPAGSDATPNFVDCAAPHAAPASRAMTWHRVASFDGLVRSPLGVEEPPADPATLIEPAACETETAASAPGAPVDPAGNPAAPAPARAIALVPGLAFDAQGYRIGYGGGYYDTFLAAFPGATVGLCRRTQLAESLRAQGVVEPHDVPVQTVVSG